MNRDYFLDLRQVISSIKAALYGSNRNEWNFRKRKIEINGIELAHKQLIGSLDDILYDFEIILRQKEFNLFDIDDVNLISKEIYDKIKIILEVNEYQDLLRSARYRPIRRIGDDARPGAIGREIRGESALVALGLAKDALRQIFDAVATPEQSGLSKDVVEIEDFRRDLPKQHISPVIFEITENRIVVSKLESKIDDQSMEGASLAREALIGHGEKIIGEIERSNCDRRLLDAVKELNESIVCGRNVIAIGINNMKCEMMCNGFSAEMPDAVVAMLQSHSRSVELYVRQFPEWNRFINNAAGFSVGKNDIERLSDGVNDLISMLKSNKSCVDSDVPAAIDKINGYAKSEFSSKGARLALVRTVENLIIKIYEFVGGFIEKTLTRTIDEISNVISKFAAKALLAIALCGAGYLGGIAERVPELRWVKGGYRNNCQAHG